MNDIKPRQVSTQPRYDQDSYLDSCHATLTYLVRAENGGPIKIGRTNNIKKRLGNLQPGNPYKLKCLGTTLVSERDVHVALKAYRIAGEWYEPSVEAETIFGVSL